LAASPWGSQKRKTQPVNEILGIKKEALFSESSYKSIAAIKLPGTKLTFRIKRKVLFKTTLY